MTQPKPMMTNFPTDIEAFYAKVQVFVADYKNRIRAAANEEEIRANLVVSVAGTLDINDLKMEQGRQDIRRNRVIIECKDKGLFLGHKGSMKFQEALTQLTTQYIPNQAKADMRPESDYTGVCFDGTHIAFVYIESGGNIRISELCDFDENTGTMLALALYRDERIELTPENVAADFGANSSIAHEILNALWNHLERSLESHTNRVEMLFSEWKDLFEQSTSLGKIGQARLNEYLKSIGIPTNANTTHILFVLHTYHALFFKLLAAEVVLANRFIPDVEGDYCFGAASLDNVSLVESLERNIEESHLFQQVNIRNFVEGSFFSWYCVQPPDMLVNTVRRLMQRLTLYRLSDLQLNRTRDIVKHIYQQLVPAALRHNIGEYFTPEWLVDFTLDRVGYQGEEILASKYLDPCCGSGNFIIHSIDRYKNMARKAKWSGAETLKQITDHIFGFDLNPLAVLTTRVNYLIAISDLINTTSEIEIPVYQADAIYAPTRKSSDLAPKATQIYEIGTRKSNIQVELPERLIVRNSLFGRVMMVMEQCIRAGNTVDIFFAHLNNEPAYMSDQDHPSWEPYLRDTYTKIEALEKEGWNRIWCRIIRNYFASVAVGSCHFVASNPPWVRWSELPSAYAKRISPTCQSYEIFSQDRFFGGNELDISAMITYTVADKWLDAKRGRLSFVITQTVFQSQSSGGFRQFVVKGTPMHVERVDDFTAVRAFEGLANKPAVMSVEMGRPTKYPVEYNRWNRQSSIAIPEDVTWDIAQQRLAFERLQAHALSDHGMRWAILPAGRFQELQVLDGEDPEIAGRKGIVTDLNGAYFVEVLGDGRRPGTFRIRNQPNLGRHRVPRQIGEVELDLIYPLIKGAENIRAFHASVSHSFVLIPNKRITPGDIPSNTEFASKYPGAFQYFQDINRRPSNNSTGLLDARSTWRSRMLPQFERLVTNGKLNRDDIPFYAIYDVGSYTFAPYKVVWAEMSGTLKAAVIGKGSLPLGNGWCPIIPDHKVYFAAFDNPEQAHFVCALLNSESVRTYIDSFTIKIQVGSLFRHVRLPIYDRDNPSHQDLAQYSKDAHEIMQQTDDNNAIRGQQVSIDTLTTSILRSASARKPE